MYGPIDPDFGIDDETLEDEQNFRVKDILKHEGSKIIYAYDFGDNWEHLITLEKILPYTVEQPLPICLKGKRGCPPEDVGGPWGYAHFLEKWVDENHPEQKELKEWAGEYFSPEKFDLAETNGILRECTHQSIATSNFL